MCVSIEPYQKQTRYLGCLQTKIPGLFLIWRTPDRAFARPGTCPVAGELHGDDSRRLHGDGAGEMHGNDSRRLHGDEAGELPGDGAGELPGDGVGEMHSNDSRRIARRRGRRNVRQRGRRCSGILPCDRIW